MAFCRRRRSQSVDIGASAKSLGVITPLVRKGAWRGSTICRSGSTQPCTCTCRLYISTSGSAPPSPPLPTSTAPCCPLPPLACQTLVVEFYRYVTFDTIELCGAKIRGAASQLSRLPQAGAACRKVTFPHASCLLGTTTRPDCRSTERLWPGETSHSETKGVRGSSAATARAARTLFTSRSVRRPLLMPQVNPGSLYRCGESD